MDCMAQQLQQKKGGPYPKNQQEKRRQQVYELHFEKGYSAVSIANELDVNRNTINEDIKFWQMQFASQFQDQDLGGIILKQIEKLEVQKKRLLQQKILNPLRLLNPLQTIRLINAQYGRLQLKG